MFTQHLNPALALTAWPRALRTQVALFGLLTLALSGCGEGGVAGNSAKPAADGTVVVKVMNTAGAPVSGALVDLSMAVGPSSPTTDASGEVTFKHAVAGPRVVAAGKSGYFPAIRNFVAAAGSDTNVTLSLDSVTVATPVVLATHPAVSSDGKTLTVDVDIAVLGEDGSALETLTGSEFEVAGTGLDCDLLNCVYDPQGHYSRYTAHVDHGTFGFIPPRSRPAIAAAVLLEQSTAMASFDPAGERRKAVNAFFESITPPDLVTLGSYQRVTGKPVLTTYGGFTSDTASLRTALSALAGQEQGPNPRTRAVAEMVAFVKAIPTAGLDDPQRAVVLVTQGQPGDSTDNESISLPDSSVPVVTVSASWLYPNAAEYAATGGAYVLAGYPEQLPVVLRGIGAIVGHSLAYNRVRIVLDAAQAGVFVPGNYLTARLSFRVSPQTVIEGIPVPIRI